MNKPAAMSFGESNPEPPPDCRLCSRLAEFRDANRSAHPDWFNGPVPCFGAKQAKLLIVGLAPGLQGANKTGRPFTGDWAGDLLYATLLKFGFAEGHYEARADDSLVLKEAMITNAVRCVPPQNKPVAAEITACRPFLAAQISALPGLRVIIALGRIAHDSTLRTLGIPLKDAPFGHNAHHRLKQHEPLLLIDSYHCSRYNTNTRRLTTEMFEHVFESARREIDKR